jgi:hypothetical protein
MPIDHETIFPDGSFDFAGGVDSQAVTTIRSEIVPHGLGRDQLSWLNNGTVRGGGILQRTGWKKLCDLVSSGLWQGGILYEPIGQDSNPYLVCGISGNIFKVLLDPPYTVTNLSAVFSLFHPVDQTAFNFCEGDGFLVIQAGDGVTKPLFYVSAFLAQPETLRRSNGFVGVGSPNNEIPPATAMVYYGQRIWYAQGRTYSGGDIVGSQASGTAGYNFRDSVLKVTENPLAIGGDGFSVPSQAGNIRALAYTANLDTTLGQGPLYIFTRKQVYACQIPVTRADWIAATNANQPLQTVAQINNGSVGERCIVHINGDLFYQSFDPAVRSLIIATRFYQQWGNPSISNNVNRALQFNDRALMKFASGIEFDNRLLQLVLPKQTPNGVVCPGMLPLDFDLVSTLQKQAPPAWEGIWEGVDSFQLFTGDFGGLPRAFSIVRNRLDQTIDIWEITNAERFDNAGYPGATENRVVWQAETPAFTWGKEFRLKELKMGEIWIDKVFGTVELDVYYRPDADPCWRLWHHTSFCAAHTCEEDVNHPDCYPVGPNFREGYKFPVVLPEPKPDCDSMGVRPSTRGYQFQVKLVFRGWCRVRGIILYAEFKGSEMYGGLSC